MINLGNLGQPFNTPQAELMVPCFTILCCVRDLCVVLFCFVVLCCVLFVVCSESNLQQILGMGGKGFSAYRKVCLHFSFSPRNEKQHHCICILLSVPLGEGV